MGNEFYNLLRNMSREEESRSKVLIHGIRQILDDRKEEHWLRAFFRKKKHIEPKTWNLPK